MSDDSIFSVREIRREIDPPWDLEMALARRAPQALLRDLHRPVTQFAVSPGDFDRYERVTDCGRAAIRAVRADIFMDLRVPIQDLLHTNRTMVEEYRAIKATLKRAWTDAPKFGMQTIPEVLARKYFG